MCCLNTMHLHCCNHARESWEIKGREKHLCKQLSSQALVDSICTVPSESQACIQTSCSNTTWACRQTHIHILPTHTHGATLHMSSCMCTAARMQAQQCGADVKKPNKVFSL
jgi:hypothetical protein